RPPPGGPSGRSAPAALGKRLGRVLGLVAPHDHVKNDASCSRRPDTATRNMARAMPPSVQRISGSSMGLPTKPTAASVMTHPSWDCLAGRSALPLEPGDDGHRGMPA